MFKIVKPVFFGLACLAFASCKKDDVSKNVTDQNSTEKAAVSDLNYYPYNNGTAYSYVDSINGVASTVSKSVAILGDTTIDGKSFSKTGDKSSSSYNYYNATDGVTTMLSFNGDEKRTTTVLKANEPVGTTWKDVFTNAGVPTTYQWTIAAKGLTRTIKDVTYNNVIEVQLVGSADLPGQGKVVLARSDYYYAPNTGLIESISYDPSTGKTQLHRVLQGNAKL
jgi:hypothetical protein